MIKPNTLKVIATSRTAIAFACALVITGNTHAQVANNSVTGVTSASVPSETTGPTTAGPLTTGSLYQSSAAGTTDASYGFGRIFSEVTGTRYGGSSYAQGINASGFGSIYKEFTFTAQQTGYYSIDTFIYGGSLYTGYTGSGSSGTGTSSYDWSMKVNGNVTQSTSYSVSVGNSGGVFSGSGTSQLLGFATNADQSYAYASWSSTSLVTDLGLLNANQSVLVSFDFSTNSFSDYVYNRTNNGNGEEGEIGCIEIVDQIGCSSGTGYSYTSFGDPSFLSGQGSDPMFSNISLTGFSFTPVSAIPEPSEWAMMLLGLGVVGSIARRRKSQ